MHTSSQSAPTKSDGHLKDESDSFLYKQNSKKKKRKCFYYRIFAPTSVKVFPHQVRERSVKTVNTHERAQIVGDGIRGYLTEECLFHFQKSGHTSSQQAPFRRGHTCTQHTHTHTRCCRCGITSEG